MMVEKPNSDVLRRRYDSAARHSGLFGHTARKAIGPPEHSIERSSALASMANARDFSYLDDRKEYGTPSTSTLREPYKLTAFEMQGFDENLDRDNGWEAIPSFLAEHSVGVPAMRKLTDGRIETSYALEPEGLLLPDPRMAEATTALANQIYVVRRHKPKLVLIVPTDAPEGVKKPLLKAALHCAGGRVPQTAIVRVNHTSNAWLVPDSMGKPLEIDLGMPCTVSHFSTQGRHLPTRRYPHVWKDSSLQGDGLWHVEDAAYRMTDAARGSRYQGPWWTVRSTEEHAGPKTHCWNDDKYHKPQWVSRYELLWRAENGRKWHSLGIFHGNSDETTEVAHAFTTFKGGLTTRYLRVVPLDSENGGAMRVGVYGEPSARGKARGVSRRAGTRERTTADIEEGERALVEYRLTAVPEGVNRRLACDGHTRSMQGGGCPCCRYQEGRSSLRLRRRKDTQRAAAAVDEMDLAREDAEAEMVMCTEQDASDGHRLSPTYIRPPAAGAPPQHPLFSRGSGRGMSAREREEEQLAVALSRSLAQQQGDEEEVQLALTLSRSLAEVAAPTATDQARSSAMGVLDGASETMSEATSAAACMPTSEPDDHSMSEAGSEGRLGSEVGFEQACSEAKEEDWDDLGEGEEGWQMVEVE